MANGAVRDPYTNYNFLVELDQVVRGAFQQVSGLDSTVDVVEYREGGDPTTRKLAGRTTHSNIVLKWGIASDNELSEWHRRISQDPSNLPAERRGGGILMLDSRGNTVCRWDFERAWPTKYVGPDLNAESSDVAVETIELAHEGIRRVL
jgi:phage tail-like protein